MPRVVFKTGVAPSIWVLCIEGAGINARFLQCHTHSYRTLIWKGLYYHMETRRQDGSAIIDRIVLNSFVVTPDKT